MQDNSLPRPATEGSQAGCGEYDRRRLNAVDRTLLAVDRTLRGMGYFGFETQTFVWLHGPADVGRLRAALAHLGRRYPLLTARLVETGDQSSPYWQFRADGQVATLREMDLSSASPQEVLEHAGRLLSTPSDLATAGPMRFYLLHRPGGRDVFLMQYNHALMEHNDAVHLLRQLDRFAACPPEGAAASPAGWRDPVWAYLRRFPRQRRRAALQATEQWLRRLRGRAVQLGRDAPAGPGRVQLRLALRRLGAVPTRALESRILRICGVPSLSMAILGSAFRALWRLAPRRAGAARGHPWYLGAALGAELRPGKAAEPRLHNLSSLLPVLARPEDLADRDGLAVLLSRQLRQRLATDTDLGMLQLTALLGRQPRRARWAVEFGLRHLLSLWYAYFGPLDGVGGRFCGAAVKEVFSAGPSWSPVGLTLLVNQFGGQLFFLATYVPETVPESLVHDFLDLLLADLEP
jgi:hypothetical protein